MRNKKNAKKVINFQQKKAKNTNNFEDKLNAERKINKYFKLDKTRRFKLLISIEAMFNPTISIIVFLILGTGFTIGCSLPFMPMPIVVKIFTTFFCIAVILVIAIAFIKLYFIPQLISVKERMQQKAALKNGDITFGYLFEYSCIKFMTGKKLKGGGNFFRICGKIQYMDFCGLAHTIALCNKKLKFDPRLTDGMALPICFDGNTALVLLDCSLVGESATNEYKTIEKENYNLSQSAPPQKIAYAKELEELYINKEYYSAQELKDISPLKNLHQIAYALSFSSSFGAFIFVFGIAISVIINNINNPTQITFAIILMVVFGGTLLFVCIFCGVHLFKPIFKACALKKYAKSSIVTYAYIVSIDKFEYTVSSDNSHRHMVRMIANYRFINDTGKIVDDVFYGTFYKGFLPNISLGQKVPVAYNAKTSMLVESFNNVKKINGLTSDNTILD